ncbi:MAG: peptidoglycan-binding protein [Deltaproteobacteria bacterium]|nr:peptidoglycan-binding protein [Deltaproteobacteria bacterium]
MKYRWQKLTITVGIIVGLAAVYVATATAAAADLNDPRAQKITTAIGFAMSRQHDRLSTITAVEPSRALRTVEGNISDPDFYLAGAAIYKVDFQNAKGNLGGLIYHRDGLSRVIMTRFKATFQETPKLVVTSVDLTPTYAPAPRSALFFVPAEQVPATGFNGLSFQAALLKANQHAIPQEGAGRADAQPRPYTVVAFMMDRQPPEMQMELVQGNPVDTRKKALQQSGKNQAGWCYTVLPATFAYNQGAEVTFNIILREGQSSWLANTYSTHSLLKRTQRALAQRGYNPGVADGQMGAKTRQAIQRFQQQQGIIVDGKPSPELLALLDATENLPGIQLAQASLKTLGYDPGPVDGQMGQKTITALRAYQTDCGLPADGVLSAGLLCYLANTAGPMPGQLGNTPASNTKVNRFESRMWPNQLATP